MKKKIIMMAAALLMAVSASAQFEQDKVYVGGSLTNLGLNYSGLQKLNFGLNAEAGYFVADNVMLKGLVGYDHSTRKGSADNLTLGIGGRYYMEENGIYLGLNAKYIHCNHNVNDLRPGIEVGYSYFLSRTVTIEPAVYYDQSFKKHSDYSTFGVKVGLGIYLFRE